MKYNSRYAKVFNEQFSKNLKNPHIVCLKSTGTPYFMFLTQINDTNYCFLIDKKIKEGYSYPKIFIAPYSFSQECYQGSLFECELIRDKKKNWILSIGDCYTMYGKTMKKTIIIERINQTHEFFEKHCIESEFMKTCPLQIKKYFDYKDFKTMNTEFVPKLTYAIRGYYFVPLRTDYSNILYLLPKVNHNEKVQKSPLPQFNKKKENLQQKQNIQQNIQQNKQNKKKFRIMKTMKPDVYELYAQEEENLIKEGIALIQTIELSHKLVKHFEGKDQFAEVYVECEYNQRFKKWKPIDFVDK